MEQRSEKISKIYDKAGKKCQCVSTPKTMYLHVALLAAKNKILQC